MNSGSNQASTSRSSKQTNHSSASQSSGSSAIRGSSGAARQSANSSSAGNTNTGNKTTSSNKKSAVSEVTNNDSSTAVTGLNQTAKQSIVQLNKDTSFSNKEGAKATSPVTGTIKDNYILSVCFWKVKATTTATCLILSPLSTYGALSPWVCVFGFASIQSDKTR